jgi:hypothetical protein
LSTVETKDKFIEIILQVFCIDTVMSAVQPGLQIAEDPMNVQGMGFGMVELVTIPSHGIFGIPSPLIGINFGSQFHILRQEATNGNFIRPFGFGQPEPTCSLHVIAMLIGIDEDFHGSKNQRTMLRAHHSSAFFAGHGTTDENFVSFHSTAKATAVRVNHSPAKALKQKPCSFITTSHLAPKLGSAHARGMGGHQVGGPKPLLQRKSTAMHQRSRGWRNLVVTLIALPQCTAFNRPIPAASTTRAVKGFWPSALPKIAHTRLLIGEPLAEPPQGLGKGWSHLSISGLYQPESRG